jgi:hypothetical protein
MGAGVFVPINPPPGMEYDFLNFDDKGNVYGVYAQGGVYLQVAQKPEKDNPELIYFQFGPGYNRELARMYSTSETTAAVQGVEYQTYTVKQSKIAANTPLRPEMLGIYGYKVGKAMLKLSGTMAKVFVDEEETARLDFDSISTTGNLTTIVSGTSNIVVEFIADDRINATYTDDKGAVTNFRRISEFEIIDPNRLPSGDGGCTSGCTPSGSGGSSDVNYGALIGLVVCVLIILGTK